MARYAIASIFLAIAALEVLLPLHATTGLTRRRWLGNIMLFGLTLGALSLPFIAALATASGRNGIFHRLTPSLWLAVPAGCVVLDLFVYWLHRLEHAAVPLWRLHAVHHSDPELDVSTTLRQHPLAAIVDAAFIAGSVVVLGIPAEAVLAYRIVEVAVQTLAHANIPLPRRLSRIVVTPAFHRLHHSPDMEQTNSNYGQVLAIWDHLFGTARSPDGRVERFGLGYFDRPAQQGVHFLLAQPVLARQGEGPPAMSRR